MKVLGNSTQCLVGHPDFLQRLSGPATPADLSGLPSVHWGAAQREYQWQLLGPDGAEALIRHRPRMVTDDLLALRHAVLAGIGIAHLPKVVVREDLEAGRLLELVPDWAPRCGIVHAIFPSRRGLLPSVRSLIDFLGRNSATATWPEAQKQAPGTARWWRLGNLPVGFRAWVRDSPASRRLQGQVDS